MKSSIILAVSIVAALGFIVGAFLFLRPQEQIGLPLLVEEYADFNCIHCKDFEPVSQRINEEYGNKINFQFINNPILGNDSLEKAFASEAAREQGKFSEYKSKMYDGFGKTGDETITQIAQELGLDMDKFNADRQSEAVQQRVTSTLDANRKKGVTSTPTIFINGKQIVDRSYENLNKIIKEKLELGEKQASESGKISNSNN